MCLLLIVFKYLLGKVLKTLTETFIEFQIEFLSVFCHGRAVLSELEFESSSKLNFTACKMETAFPWVIYPPS